jgi:pectate lyase
MLLTSDAAFGFGQNVTGGGAASEKTITTRQQLIDELTLLGSSTVNGPTVLTLTEGDYEFRGERTRTFEIGAQNLTLRAAAGQRVELKNLGLSLDLASIDNILIQNLAFHSDGDVGPEDGILFDGTNSSSGFTNRVRITRCTFDGYKDIAIEMRSHRSLVLATIDHCHFVDRHPGARPPFVDRGAIDIASVIMDDEAKTRLPGNSAVTVAFNLFEDVWRRSPRVAQTGNFGHVFNNLLYRWGFGNNQNEIGSWNGVSIGNEPYLRGETAAAVHANRFIPWADKATGPAARHAFEHDTNTRVNIGGQPYPNRFDKPDGTPDTNSPLAPQPDRQNHFPAAVQVRDRYRSLSPSLTPPAVTPADQVPWQTVIDQAGTLVPDPRYPRLTI